MWKPDGWSVRARLGVIVPHAAIGTESELQAMAPQGVSIHSTRVPLGVMRAGGVMDPTIALEPVRAFADPPLVDEAAALLAAAPLHAIGFGFTSSSYVRGAADDESLRQRLEARTRGIPVAVTSVSAVLGLRALGAGRVALVDPPWFSPELTALGVDYFRAHGFEVIHAEAAALPSDQQAIHPGQLFEWVRDHVPAECRGGLYRRQRLAVGRSHPGFGGGLADPSAYGQSGAVLASAAAGWDARAGSRVWAPVRSRSAWGGRVVNVRATGWHATLISEPW